MSEDRDAAGRTDPGSRAPVPEPLPPDPSRYDSPRAELARARGLDKPYIPGGDDPEPEKANREERFYGRILLIMIVVIVSAGFVLGIVGSILGGGG